MVGKSMIGKRVVLRYHTALTGTLSDFMHGAALVDWDTGKREVLPSDAVILLAQRGRDNLPTPRRQMGRERRARARPVR